MSSFLDMFSISCQSHSRSSGLHIRACPVASAGHVEASAATSWIHPTASEIRMQASGLLPL